jgi:hypothetical protein
MSRRSNSFDVAVLDLPSWADYTSLPVGKFKEFTLNIPADVGMQRASLYNWVGGAFVPDFGPRGGVCYHGGGEHSTWADSAVSGNGQQGVYVLDCDTRLYSRKCYPTTNHTGVVSDGTGGPTDDWGAYTDDGSPQSKHTYNGMSYMPAAWGGGPQGSLVRVAHAGGLSTSKALINGVAQMGYSALWRFDLSKPLHSAADPSIQKLTGSSLYDFGSGPGATINDAPMACIDLKRGGWWATHRGASGWGSRMVFTSKAGVISSPQGQPLSTEWAALHHLADDDIVVRLSDHQLQNGVVPIWQVHVWQAGTSSGWVQAKVNRQDIADLNALGVKAYPSIGEMHPRWSSVLNCFVGLDALYPVGNQPTQVIRVWKITPPPAGQRFSGTWQISWELITAVSGSPTNELHMLNGNVAGDAGTVNGVYGRFVECPNLRAFIWTRDVSKPGQLVRLQGM